MAQPPSLFEVTARHPYVRRFVANPNAAVTLSSDVVERIDAIQCTDLITAVRYDRADCFDRLLHKLVDGPGVIVENRNVQPVRVNIWAQDDVWFDMPVTYEVYTSRVYELIDNALTEMTWDKMAMSKYLVRNILEGLKLPLREFITSGPDPNLLRADLWYHLRSQYLPRRYFEALLNGGDMTTVYNILDETEAMLITLTWPRYSRPLLWLSQWAIENFRSGVLEYVYDTYGRIGDNYKDNKRHFEDLIYSYNGDVGVSLYVRLGQVIYGPFEEDGESGDRWSYKWYRTLMDVVNMYRQDNGYDGAYTDSDDDDADSDDDDDGDDYGESYDE